VRLNPHATRTVLDSYGLSKVSGEDLGVVARGRTPFKPLDPSMQRLRDAQGVNMAFEDNAQIDPTNPNPEPGVMHRADDGDGLGKEAGALVDLRKAMAANHRKWGLRAVLMAAHMGNPQGLINQAPTPAHTALLESFGKFRNRAQSVAAQDYIYKLPDLTTKTGTVSSREKQVRRGMVALSGGHDFHGSGNLAALIEAGWLAPGHRNTFGKGVYYTQDKPVREYWNDTFAHGSREGGVIVPRNVSQSVPAKFFSDALGAYRVGPAIPLSKEMTIAYNTRNPRASQAMATAQRKYHIRPMTMDAMAEAADRLRVEAPVMSKTYQSLLNQMKTQPLLHGILSKLERVAMGGRALMGRV